MQLLTLSRRHLRFFREILISLTPHSVRMSWQTNSDKTPSAEEEKLLLKNQVLKETDKWVVDNR
jgi:rubrerythrin